MALNEKVKGKILSHKSYNVTSRSDNIYRQSHVTWCIETGLMISNGDAKGPGAFKVANNILVYFPFTQSEV